MACTIIIIYQAGVICFDVVKMTCPVALVLLLSLQDGYFWKDWIYRNILCSLLDLVWTSFAFSALFAGGFWLSDVESGGGVAAYNGYFIFNTINRRLYNNIPATTTACKYSNRCGVKVCNIDEVPTNWLFAPWKPMANPLYPSSSSSLNCII